MIHFGPATVTGAVNLVKLCLHCQFGHYNSCKVVIIIGWPIKGPILSLANAFILFALVKRCLTQNSVSVAHTHTLDLSKFSFFPHRYYHINNSTGDTQQLHQLEVETFHLPFLLPVGGFMQYTSHFVQAKERKPLLIAAAGQMAGHCFPSLRKSLWRANVADTNASIKLAISGQWIWFLGICWIRCTGPSEVWPGSFSLFAHIFPPRSLPFVTLLLGRFLPAQKATSAWTTRREAGEETHEWKLQCKSKVQLEKFN